MDKKRSTIMLREDVFKDTRIYAIKKGMDISEFTEEALKEKIERIQEEEQKQKQQAELTATINVAKRLYQQLKQKSDFNPTMSEEFIKTITAGVEPKYRDYVTKEILKEEIEQPQQQQQPLQKPVIKFIVNLPGIEFPADRSEIIEYAEKGNIKPIIDFLESVPNRKYKNKSDLENELSIEVMTTNLPQAHEFIDKGGSIRFEIDDRELTREQNKERKQKQESQLRSMQST